MKTRRMAPRQRKEVDTSTYAGRFAVRLRSLRDKAKLSVPELAEKTGIPRTTLFNWEMGRTAPPLNSYPILAKAYGIKVRNLFPES
jgi:transcriptional regulator with XRE-family HTH domain